MAQEIIISINVTSKEAQAKVDRLKKSTDDLSVSTKEAAVSVDRMAKSEREAAIQDELAAQKKALLRKEIKAEAAARLSLDKSINRNKTNAGLNNAIIAESARLASDASYGFTAIANNLGQLVSLFSASARAAGGLASAIKAIFTVQSLFLISIQLLITYGKDIYNFFAGIDEGAKEAAEAIKEATKAMDEQIQRFDDLAKFTSKYGATNKLLQEDLARLRNEFKDFEVGFQKLTKEQQNSDEAILKLIKDYELFLDAQRELNRLEEVLRQTRAKGEDGTGSVLKATQNYRDQYDLVLRLQKRFRRDDKKTTKEAAKNIETLRDIAFRTYEQRLSDFDRFAEKARNKELNFIKRVGVEKIEFQKQQAIRELDLEATQKVEQEKIRYEGYLSDIALRKQTLTERINEKEKELILEAKTEDEKQRIRDNAELRRSQVQAEYLRARTDANEKYGQSLEFIATSFANATNSVTESYGSIQDEFVEQQELTDLSQFGQLAIDGIQQRIEAEKSLSRSVFDRIDLEKELEKSRHEEKMGQLKDELRQAEVNGESTLAVQQKITNEEQRYSNTKKSIAQKERDAKVDLINDVADVFLMAAKEGSDIAKAVAIFAATVNTYEAVTAALGAKPYTPLNIAQAVAVGAKGFLQVREIARTPKPLGGGGGGAAVQAPSFNVVGASPTNQLLNVAANALDPANQPAPQILPVAFEGDLFDGINDGNRNGLDPDGFRSIGG